MALTPEELDLLTVWHEQYCQGPVLTLAHEARLRAVAPQWHALLVRQQDEGKRSAGHVEQVAATMAFVAQYLPEGDRATARADTPAAVVPPEAPPAAASEDAPGETIEIHRPGHEPERFQTGRRPR